MTVVTVFGASGYVGSNLIPELLKSDYVVRAVARNKEVLESRFWTGVELFEADVLTSSSLASSLEGTDIAVYLIHSMSAGSEFEELDRVAALNFAKEAELHNDKRIIYLGGIQPPDE